MRNQIESNNTTITIAPHLNICAYSNTGNGTIFIWVFPAASASWNRKGTQRSRKSLRTSQWITHLLASLTDWSKSKYLKFSNCKFLQISSITGTSYHLLNFPSNASKIPYWSSLRTYLQAPKKNQNSEIKHGQFVHPCRMSHCSVTPNTISGAWKNFPTRKFSHPPPDCA